MLHTTSEPEGGKKWSMSVIILKHQRLTSEGRRSNELLYPTTPEHDMGGS